MTTRADFYLGRGTDAEWLGSIALDGYPDGVPTEILEASNEATYRELVSRFLADRDDGTVPDQGWPWPWPDSHTTDYAYAFDGGTVYVCRYDSGWQAASDYDADHAGPAPVYPDMSDRKAVTYGPRSGLQIY